jgi:hypothetical protein
MKKKLQFDQDRESLIDGLTRIVCNTSQEIQFRKAAMQVLRRVISGRSAGTVRAMEKSRGIV